MITARYSVRDFTRFPVASCSACLMLASGVDCMSRSLLWRGKTTDVLIAARKSTIDYTYAHVHIIIDIPYIDCKAQDLDDCMLTPTSCINQQKQLQITRTLFWVFRSGQGSYSPRKYLAAEKTASTDLSLSWFCGSHSTLG